MSNALINTIYGINGPVITLKEAGELGMLDMVYVGEKKLTGEVIRIDDDKTVIQVYEDTSGLKPSQPVYPTGGPMCAVLGPGIIRNIFDGIQNPLKTVAELTGDFISRGVNATPLDEEKEWETLITVSLGDLLKEGDFYAEIPETPVVTHRLMVPLGLSGEVIWSASNGRYKLNDSVLKIRDKDGREHPLTLCQRWPIRTPRPASKRLPLSRPLITGQRILDTLYPIAKGGAAAVPGGFGTGKTVTQHQLAKWCDADIIIYVGCGERGNEMTQALAEFSQITDPRTGRPLTDRTVLIANTSNMPVAAREASIYTGITIAEYYRDMGYHTALMADSTSRWAEALREMSGRLEEMPGEEGYPAYLSSRLAQFYERAGRVVALGSDSREGAISAIGAVSPPGGDISEPVSQATLRIVKVFWGLDAALAYRRHFPAINWLTSYSLYSDTLGGWFNKNVANDWTALRQKMLKLLSEEAALEEIVRLVGMDALSPEDRLIMEAARSIREDFLHQLAFHEVDTYTSLKKQNLMMKLVILYYDSALAALEKGADIESLVNLEVREAIGRFKYVPEDSAPAEYEKVSSRLADELNKTLEKEEHF